MPGCFALPRPELQSENCPQATGLLGYDEIEENHDPVRISIGEQSCSLPAGGEAGSGGRKQVKLAFELRLIHRPTVLGSG